MANQRVGWKFQKGADAYELYYTLCGLSDRWVPSEDEAAYRSLKSLHDLYLKRSERDFSSLRTAAEFIRFREEELAAHPERIRFGRSGDRADYYFCRENGAEFSIMLCDDRSVHSFSFEDYFGRLLSHFDDTVSEEYRARYKELESLPGGGPSLSGKRSYGAYAALITDLLLEDQCEGARNASLLLEEVFCGRDSYYITRKQGNTEITGVNYMGTLYPGTGSERSSLLAKPGALCDFYRRTHSAVSYVFENGWKLNMRIHAHSAAAVSGTDISFSVGSYPDNLLTRKFRE